MIYKWTAKEIVQLIRNKYSEAQRYMTFEQVANGTGYNIGRSWIDVAVMCLWPSDGLKTIAFEVKVSRSDFTREIERGKNDWVLNDFDKFYYVAPQSVIKSEDEVPERCGWYIPTKGGLRLKKVAQTINHEGNMGIDFFASLCRSTGKELTKNSDAVLKTAKLEDSEILSWKRDSDALVAYLKKYNRYITYRKTVKEVVEVLEESRVLSKDKVEIEIITRRLDMFRSAIENLSDEFMTLANVTLLETNAAEEYILERYGTAGLKLAKERKAKR